MLCPERVTRTCLERIHTRLALWWPLTETVQELCRSCVARARPEGAYGLDPKRPQLRSIVLYYSSPNVSRTNLAFASLPGQLGFEGKREDVQWIQDLVPLRHLSLNLNVCGLRRCLRVGHSNEQVPLEERIFLDTWDISSAED